uniref:Uncharacterized protein n=1 Tax=Anguilla anguilla TaxID=7936 RepID=A0A0E9VRI5_ANGAN
MRFLKFKFQFHFLRQSLKFDMLLDEKIHFFNRSKRLGVKRLLTLCT